MWLPPPPSAAELHAFAAYIGLELGEASGCAQHRWIAAECACAQLPAPWRRVQDTEGRVFYVSDADGSTAWDHPLDAFFRALTSHANRVWRDTGRPLLPATAAEVCDMARYLGIDTVREPRLLYIARLGVVAPLEPPWRAEKTVGNVERFRNSATGEVRETHPMDGFLCDLVDAERQASGASAAASPSSSPPRCQFFVVFRADGTAIYVHSGTLREQLEYPQRASSPAAIAARLASDAGTIRGRLDGAWRVSDVGVRPRSPAAAPGLTLDLSALRRQHGPSARARAPSSRPLSAAAISSRVRAATARSLAAPLSSRWSSLAGAPLGASTARPASAAHARATAQHPSSRAENHMVTLERSNLPYDMCEQLAHELNSHERTEADHALMFDIVVTIRGKRRRAELRYLTESGACRVSVPSEHMCFDFEFLSYANGERVHVWDLAVGHRVCVFEQVVTLLKAAPETVRWIEMKRRRLCSVRNTLLSHLERAGEPTAEQVSFLHAHPGTRSLRPLLAEIRVLADRLLEVADGDVAEHLRIVRDDLAHEFA